MTRRRIRIVSNIAAVLIAVVYGVLLDSPTPVAADGTLEADGMSRVLRIAGVALVVNVALLLLLSHFFGPKKDT